MNRPSEADASRLHWVNYADHLEAEVERLEGIEKAAQHAADCLAIDKFQRDSVIALREALEAGDV